MKEAMSKTIAMTGATGFAGRHAVAEVLKRGHKVVALARNAARAGLPAEVKIIAGDLSSAAALEALMAGADSVIHLAGAISAIGRDGFFQVNAAGTEAAARAAAASGASRFIHISSLAAREPQLSHYGASKRAGEDLAARHVPAGKLLVIRPPVVYGPGDRATLPLLKALTGRTAIIPGHRASRFSLIHVQDLARLIADAAVGSTIGEVEVSDGRAGGYGWTDLADIAGRSQGHAVRVMFLPRPVPGAIAPLAEVLALITGKPGMVSRGKIAELYHRDWVVRGAGLTLADPITFEQGFTQTLHWYRTAGWLPAARRTDRSRSERTEAGP